MPRLQTRTRQAYIRAVLKLSAYLITLNATLPGLKLYFDLTLD